VIGMHLKLQARERALGQDDLAAQPDLAGGPRSPIDTVGSALVAETPWAGLPGQVVEVRLEPVISRLRERVAPTLFLVPGGRDDHDELRPAWDSQESNDNHRDSGLHEMRLPSYGSCQCTPHGSLSLIIGSGGPDTTTEVLAMLVAMAGLPGSGKSTIASQ